MLRFFKSHKEITAMLVAYAIVICAIIINFPEIYIKERNDYYLRDSANFLVANICLLMTAFSKKANILAKELWSEDELRIKENPYKKNKKERFNVKQGFLPDIKRERYLPINYIIFLVLACNLSLIVFARIYPKINDITGITNSWASLLNYFLISFITLSMIAVIIFFSKPFLLFLDYCAIFVISYEGFRKITFCMYWGCCGGLPWEGFLSHYNKQLEQNLFNIQLVDAIWMWLLIIFFMAFIIKSKRYRPGIAAPIMVIAFSFFRSISEFFRNDQLLVAGLRWNGISSVHIACVLISLIAIIYLILLPKLPWLQNQIKLRAKKLFFILAKIFNKFIYGSLRKN